MLRLALMWSKYPLHHQLGCILFFSVEWLEQLKKRMKCVFMPLHANQIQSLQLHHPDSGNQGA
jgi:hypothetical protein